MGEHKKEFYLASGQVITSLKGFAKALSHMAEDTYRAHVNHEKNDFANWTKHSLGKEELAKRIDGQISRIELELEILRHIVHNEKKIKTKSKAKSKTKKTSVSKKTKTKNN